MPLCIGAVDQLQERGGGSSCADRVVLRSSVCAWLHVDAAWQAVRRVNTIRCSICNMPGMREIGRHVCLLFFFGLQMRCRPSLSMVVSMSWCEHHADTHTHYTAHAENELECAATVSVCVKKIQIMSVVLSTDCF